MPMVENPLVRNCEPECSEPVEAIVKGNIPEWLNGTLLRNGPGLREIGGKKLQHMFDGLSVLHQYEIENGRVRYRNRYLRSEAYTRNMSAKRVVISEFGTRALPDPCRSLFKRYMSYFSMGKLSDNAAVSIYPIGDKLYASTESPRIWEIDPKSLDSIERLDMTDYVVVNTYSAHPHIERDGVIYNMGSNFVGKGSYKIIKTIPKSSSTGMMEVSVVCSIPVRHPLSPSYYHSFSMTEDYIIFVEQALCIALPTLVKNYMSGKTFSSSMRWKPNFKNRFIVVEKRSGKIISTKYYSEPFVYLHTINAYQEDGHIVCDICCYDDGQALQYLFGEKIIDVIEKMRSGMVADTLYGKCLRSRAKRFVIPLETAMEKRRGNLVQLKSTSATAIAVGKKILLTPEYLSPESMPLVEMAQINYAHYNGRKYRYFYCVTRNNKFNFQLGKVDTLDKTAIIWKEKDHFISEPIFVPKPNATSEDDGVILAAAVSELEENKGFLVFLDGKSFEELARAEFTTSSPLVNDFHGIFWSKTG
ncbi:carotenoid-cleaving dioxygenase, mitochondrial-like [Brevipalpus obovatus]|uniref:carotenoid-cleaving dioxygenase, mitochondrial-like n=1 Tax=Brevipalpus obovatus TaxID=246614 RepID=UPI003D9EC0EB